MVSALAYGHLEKKKNTFMIGGEQDRREMNSLLKEGPTVEDHVVATEIRPR